MRTLLAATFLLLTTTVFAQNPLQISNKLIAITQSSIYGSGTICVASSGTLCQKHGYHTAAITPQQAYSKNHGTFQGDMQKAFEAIAVAYNNEGYRLTSFTPFDKRDNNLTAYMIFEKSDSYKEQELRKLSNELVARIDTVAKRYIDSATAVINLNVLNYLNQIPKDVISKEYAESIRQLIVADMDNRLKALKEEVVRELRQTTAGH